MGIYSELDIAFELKPKTPAKIIRPLSWLLNTETRGPIWTVCPHPTDDPFFKLARHHQIGENYGNDTPNWNSSYEVSGKAVCRTYCKNYDHQIEAFLTWIMPYIAGEWNKTQLGTFWSEGGFDEINLPVILGKGIDWSARVQRSS